MTIQRGRDLLSQSNPSASDLKKSITALEQERQYVMNCVELGFREKTAGDATVEEISALIDDLEEKLKCTN
jgi:hypothetical protein